MDRKVIEWKNIRNIWIYNSIQNTNDLYTKYVKDINKTIVKSQKNTINMGKRYVQFIRRWGNAF